MKQPQTNATPRDRRLDDNQESILLDLCRYMYKNHIYFYVKDKKCIGGKKTVITTEVFKSMMDKPHEPFGGE